MPYQTFGDLRLNFPGHTRYTNYYRELSLDSARAVVRYEVDGVRYLRETFTSFPDQVVITRVTASQPGKITFNATMTSPHQDVIITSEGNDITLEGVSSLHEAHQFFFHSQEGLQTNHRKNLSSKLLQSV